MIAYSVSRLLVTVRVFPPRIRYLRDDPSGFRVARLVDSLLRMSNSVLAALSSVTDSLNAAISFTREGYFDVDASVPADAMTVLAVELDVYMATHWTARASYAITHGKEWVATGIAIGAYTVVPSSVEAYLAIGSSNPSTAANTRR